MGSIGQGLELKQQQKLNPLQIQTIKLIELTGQELEQRIRAELEQNPVLDDTPDPESEEERTEVSLDALKEDDSIAPYKLKVNNWGKDPMPEYNTFSVHESFSQSLSDQLGYCELDERQRQIAQFIIGSLDDDGYLRRDIPTLTDDLAFRAGINTTEEEVESMLKLVQSFDPPGTGARDLRECLLLQLRAKKRSQAVEDAERILDQCYNDFSNKHFAKIMSRLSLSEERLKAATAKILHLNPSPGGQSSGGYEDRTQQIVPDFVLTEGEDGRFSFDMPRFSIPQLRVNKKYAQMLMDSKSGSERAQKEAVTFVKKKLDSAKWFVEAVKQRHNTLQKTMQAILDYQYDYFRDGDDSELKPMVLKDIAEKTGFDISTVSRVVNSKYIETHFGIIPLKYFFSEGMENSDGEEVSTRELKKALQECIAAEDKKKPLTDEQLVDAMADKGYKVARRTIAKYRGQLGIPLARWRKEI
ncbi:MAG: RNA polymerase factor sigma-54 [Bacteroidales bacterium]|nr:RNA polymerase factor sigma-54 [Bacteroidales bacterium]